MKKEQRWMIRYAVPTAEGHESVKTCWPRSEEKRQEALDQCRKLGYRIISCKKLYPFNTYANQHNFELINNICYNRMWDMDHGEAEYDNTEYLRLQGLQEKAERFFELPLPTAWIPWEDWKDAKELSEMAILHRQDACIAAGRPDLVTYC